MEYGFIIFGILIGVMIGLLFPKHYDGIFIIDDLDNETTQWIIDMKSDPKNLYNKKEIRLKIKKVPNSNIVSH